MKAKKEDKANGCFEDELQGLIKGVKSLAWETIGKRNPVLAHRVANAVEAAINNAVGGDEIPVRGVPLKLRRKSWNRRAFERAIEEKYIGYENGRIVSHFETTVQLSYFCGRCFSNDYVGLVVRRRCWMKGKGRFPARELERLFGVKNLRESRKNNLGKMISESMEVVESLFVRDEDRK